MKSVNFEFMRPGNEVLANLAGLAEAVLHIDPGSALTRLRSFAEDLTKAVYKEALLPLHHRHSHQESHDRHRRPQRLWQIDHSHSLGHLL